MIPRNAAGIVFHDIFTDTVYLQLRDDGRWDFPAGGQNPDETPLDTAIRETYEETGILTSSRAVHDVRLYEKMTGKPGIFVAFYVPVAYQFHPDLSAEHVAWGWFPAWSWPSPLVPGVRRTLRDFRG